MFAFSEHFKLAECALNHAFAGPEVYHKVTVTLFPKLIKIPEMIKEALNLW